MAGNKPVNGQCDDAVGEPVKNKFSEFGSHCSSESDFRLKSFDPGPKATFGKFKPVWDAHADLRTEHLVI